MAKFGCILNVDCTELDTPMYDWRGLRPYLTVFVESSFQDEIIAWIRSEPFMGRTEERSAKPLQRLVC